MWSIDKFIEYKKAGIYLFSLSKTSPNFHINAQNWSKKQTAKQLSSSILFVLVIGTTLELKNSNKKKIRWFR
jgi:hypothetical protein